MGKAFSELGSMWTPPPLYTNGSTLYLIHLSVKRVKNPSAFFCNPASTNNVFVLSEYYIGFGKYRTLNYVKQCTVAYGNYVPRSHPLSFLMANYLNYDALTL